MAALSGRQYTLTAGEHAAVVTEVGAGLRSYTHAGADVTCSFGEDELPPKGCGATLVPWPNRLAGGRYTFDGVEYQVALTEPGAGNANHGLGRWVRWARVRQDGSAVTLRCDLVPQTGWPFQVRVDVTYALDAGTGLTVTQTARNTGRTAAPFGAGAHPYLSTRGEPLERTTVRLPARESLVVDDAQVPTGTAPVAGTPLDLRRGRRLRDLRMDDGFTALTHGDDGRGRAEVRGPAGGAQLWFDGAYRYLQVFTRENLTPGQHGVAIEPMSCAANAFNSGDGLLRLEPGDTWTGSWGVVPL